MNMMVEKCFSFFGILIQCLLLSCLPASKLVSKTSTVCLQDRRNRRSRTASMEIESAIKESCGSPDTAQSRVEQSASHSSDQMTRA